MARQLERAKAKFMPGEASAAADMEKYPGYPTAGKRLLYGPDRTAGADEIGELTSGMREDANVAPRVAASGEPGGRF